MELVDSQLNIILIKSGEASDFQVNPRLMEPLGRLLNPSKATLLRILMNNLAMIASLSVTLPVWDKK